MKSSYEWVINKSDTDLFGFKTAKITVVSPSDVKNLIKSLKKGGVRYAVYRIPANKIELIHALEKSGFVLVDGFIELQTETKSVKKTDKNIIAAIEGHIKELRALAASIFETTRYFNDPLIPRQTAKQRYAEWIENSVNGIMADETWIYFENDTILGFATIHYKNAEIPLVGVAKQAQGKGISRKLVAHAVGRMRKKGIPVAFIGTQIQNIPALRSYKAAGFKEHASYLTFRWSDLLH